MGLVCGEMPRGRARAQPGPCGVGTGQGRGRWWLWRHRGACSRHGFPPPAPLWEPRAFLLLLLPHRGVLALLWGSAVKSKSVNPHGVTKHALCKPLRSRSPPPPPKSPAHQERSQAPGFSMGSCLPSPWRSHGAAGSSRAWHRPHPGPINLSRGRAKAGRAPQRPAAWAHDDMDTPKSLVSLSPNCPSGPEVGCPQVPREADRWDHQDCL